MASDYCPRCANPEGEWGKQKDPRFPRDRAKWVCRGCRLELEAVHATIIERGGPHAAPTPAEFAAADDLPLSILVDALEAASTRARTLPPGAISISPGATVADLLELMLVGDDPDPLDVLEDDARRHAQAAARTALETVPDDDERLTPQQILDAAQVDIDAILRRHGLVD